MKFNLKIIPVILHLFLAPIATADESIYQISVPFAGCEKDFGSGENTWFFCPNWATTYTTNAISATNHPLIQSLPIHNRIRVGFVCRSLQPVWATLSILDHVFQIKPERIMTYQEFDVSLNNVDAGVAKWNLSVSFRKAEFVSVIQGCGFDVSRNISFIHAPTLKIYADYVVSNLKDLREIADNLSKVSNTDLSAVRVSLNSAIQNIESALEKTTDAGGKFLLNQTLRRLRQSLSDISQACSTPTALACTQSLANAQTKVNADIDDRADELADIKDFLDDEISRLKNLDQSIKSELQAIRDGI